MYKENFFIQNFVHKDYHTIVSRQANAMANYCKQQQKICSPYLILYENEERKKNIFIQITATHNK